MATNKKQSTSQRLASIESSILEIQEQMSHTKKQMESLDRVIADLQEIKKNTKRKKVSLFSRIRKKPEEDKMSQVATLLKNPVLQSVLQKSGKFGKGIDLSNIASLLQEPMIQSMINPKLNKGKAPTKKSPGVASGMPEILKLIQSPAIQTLLKNL
ncbi:MAG TPA: hypothetical protein VJ824_15725 [Bacillota bacterium]|nr:hypothetical protein [Bacillota bacterium]